MERYIEIHSLDEVDDNEIIEAYHGDLGMKNYTFRKSDEKAEFAIEEARSGACRLLVWREIGRDVPVVLPESDNKQYICNLLLPCLQATRNLFDLAKLEYDADKEIVVATFDNGFTKTINVEADSGTAMIKDIMRYIL